MRTSICCISALMIAVGIAGEALAAENNVEPGCFNSFVPDAAAGQKARPRAFVTPCLRVPSATAKTMPTVNAVSPHQTHFHIYLQPPKLEVIHAANALKVADAGNTTMPASATDALILADATTKVITPEIVSKINKALANKCTSSENQSFVEGRKAYLGGMTTGAAVVAMLKYTYKVEATGVVKAIITQQPMHGKVAVVGLDTQSFPGIALEVFQYTPDKDFLGDDKVDFEVTVNGQKFRVSVVVKVVTSGAFNDACLPPDADSSVSSTDVQIAIEDVQLLQDAKAPELSAAIKGARHTIVL